jgi:SAM-dependent methyltransferase
MAAPEDTTASAGPTSAAPELDIGALYTRLQREIRRSGNVGWDGANGRAAARDLAERYWAVRAERPLERRPGLAGALTYTVKRMLRPLLRWYVEPLAYEQRMFNDAALKLIDSLSERLDREAAAVTPRLLGDTDTLRERRRVYVDDFRDAAPVLDIGCGRGEFLGLLRDTGVDARGIDDDADMVDFARGEGLAVEQRDAVSYLESVGDGTLGGIFMAHIVEHLPVPILLRTLELCAQKLRAGGLLIAETINPLSPLALRNYFADLTHTQPLVPETFVLLARRAGFASVDTRFLDPPPRPDGVSDAVAEILFAPLDYALVVRA